MERKCRTAFEVCARRLPAPRQLLATRYGAARNLYRRGEVVQFWRWHVDCRYPRAATHTAGEMVPARLPMGRHRHSVVSALLHEGQQGPSRIG